MVRAWNTARAVALAQLAIRDGRAPICVHPGIVPLYGLEETEEARAVGLSVDVALVRLVSASASGELWVLLTDDGETTAGVRQEILAFAALRPGRSSPTAKRRGTWADYRQAFGGARMAETWASLEQRPTAAELERFLTALQGGS